MAGLNKITIIGNLGRDPEVRYTPDGLAVTSFSVAVTERYKGEDNTMWFRVSAFGKLGEICGNYLSKGKQVFIEGKLRTNEWDDRDGNKRFGLDILAREMVMLGSKSDAYSGPDSSDGGYSGGGGGGYNQPRQAPRQEEKKPEPAPSQEPPPDEDDIPF